MIADALPIGLAFAMLVQTAAIAFWAGRMTQRLTAVEKIAGDSEKVTRLVVEMEHATAGIERLEHQMENVQRQLANIATGRMGQSGVLP
jgi:hypothetical protein